ncbi:DedA family protein [Pseudactinotalea sp. Z1732]|uniref:DedA family protein n=1 Tax=Micrococcales TaxID=85006 RepID=UPI003C7C2292
MIDLILEGAASPWSLVVLLAFCLIDGIFPPVPSESLVIAMASLNAQGEGQSLWLLIPAAALGAFCGDLLAYLIGTKVDVHSLRLFRGPRGRRTLAWASKAIHQRGGAFILAARYIPVGRVAVNLSAGALGFPLRRFIGFAAVASVMWSLYSVALGVGAGALLYGRPLLGVLVGVVAGVGLGTLIDLGMRRFFPPPVPAPPVLPNPREEVTVSDGG